MKILIASFNRASDGGLEYLIDKLKGEDMWMDDKNEADYIMAVGDRRETFDFVLPAFRSNKKIIHLWAGEQACWATHDDVYRHAITLMSCMQLCINPTSKKRVEALCKSVGKRPNAHVVGNIRLDDLSYDKSMVPCEDYILVLYNPITIATEEDVKKEIQEVKKHIKSFGIKCIWIEPNGDMYSDLIMSNVNQKNLPRKQFLGLLKNCKAFITNSSCQYSEASFFLNQEQIISVGKRNAERGSKYADMTITGASDKIIKILKELI